MNNFFCNNKIQKTDSEQTFSEINSNYRREYSKGKSFKVSIWNEKDTYNNDDFVQDFVIYNQSLWARIDSTPSTNEVPTKGPWAKVMDGVSDVQFKEDGNKIFWKYEDESEWKDLFELDVVSESEIRNMLKDIATDVDSNFYDKTLSETSVNAVQNKVITQALNKKADKTELSKKQDVISDLSEIRDKAKSALQSVPSEYVTESELANKGYLTEHQDISGKQDKIADLAQIRANAQKGATALQTVPAEYATKTDVSKEVAKIVNSAPEAFNTLKEIADWIEEDAEPAIVLANKVEQKADKSELVIKKSKGTSSAIQEVEVESFVDETPDSFTNGQEIPTEASGNHSVVLNGKSNASAKRAFAHGNRTIAQGENSHTEGHCTQVLNVSEVLNGYAAHAEGYGTLAYGTYSHVEGNRCKTYGANSHAEGYLSVSMKEVAHAEGYGTSAEAPASHTEGNNTRTSKAYSHAEGRRTETIGEASHTEGNETITEGDYAHAEGWMTRAKGAYSHSEGQYTFTYADAAHSEGNNTHAQAPFSHAEGIGTKTNPNIAGQHVEGYFNAESDGVKVIGCGTADDARMNAVEVKQDGRVFVKGLGNYDGTNSNEAADLKHVIDNKANSGEVYNKTELDNRLKADFVQKVEVATINGQSLINGGNIVIEGGGSSYDDTEIKQELTELSAKIENININSIPIVKSKDELGKLDVPMGSIGSIVSEERTVEIKPSQVEPGTIIKEIKFNPTPPNYFDYANEHNFDFGFSCELSSGSSAISVRADKHGPSFDWRYIINGSEEVALFFTKQGGQTVFEDEAILSLNEMLMDLSYKHHGLDYMNNIGIYDEYFIEIVNNFIDSCITFVCYKPAEVSGPYVKTSNGTDEPTPRKFSDFGLQPELFSKEERIVKNFEFLNSTAFGGGIIGFETIGGSVIKLIQTGGEEEPPYGSWVISYDDDSKPLTEEELQKFKELVNSTTVYYTLLVGADSFMPSVDTLVSADFPLPPLKELKTWTPVAAPISSDDINSLLDEVFGGGYGGYYYSDDGIGSWDDDTDDSPITITFSYFGENPEDYPIEERVIKNIQYIGDWTTQEEDQIQIGLITTNNVEIYIDSLKHGGLRIFAYCGSYDTGWVEATEDVLQELNNYIESNTTYLQFVSDCTDVDNTFTAEFPNVVTQQSEEIENINTENNETGS